MRLMRLCIYGSLVVVNRDLFWARAVLYPLFMALFGKMVAAVLLALVLSYSSVYADDGDWPNMNHDPYGTNYSPQQKITKDNVNRLDVVWSIEIPRFMDGLGYGVIGPPLVIDGVVYLATNTPSILAVDASNGKILWEYRPRLQKIPLTPPHIHGINYYNGFILYPSPDCSIKLVDASTGTEKASIKSICDNVPGNAGDYSVEAAPVMDVERNIIVWGPSAAGGTASGRGFVAGFSPNGTMLWRLFITPPAGGDQLWGFRYVVERGGRFFEGRAKGNVEPMLGDWGDLGLREGRTRAGAGLSFGHISVDSERGVAYLSTSNPKPDWNATYRPGPNLYSSSVIAINITTGEMLWFYQVVSHDFYDHDCAWNTVLAKTLNMVVKGCKNGELVALNASNGDLLWRFNPPSLVKTIQPSIMKRWHNDPSDQSFLQCPGAFGGIESDIALAYGKVFVAVMNLCTVHVPTPVEQYGEVVKGSVYNIAPTPINTTIYAVDLSNGEVKWSFFVDSAYRGWLTATGGMVIASTVNRGMIFLDAETGKPIHSISFDGTLRTGAVVGRDREGRYIILQLVEKQGQYSETGTKQILVALSLGEERTEPWAITLLFIAAAVTLVFLRLRLRKR